MKTLTDNEAFLMHCINHLSDHKGSLNWELIAKEANIITPFAARQKMVRFRKAMRDMKEGAGTSGSSATPPDGDLPSPTTPKKGRKPKDLLSPKTTKVVKKSPRKGSVVGVEKREFEEEEEVGVKELVEGFGGIRPEEMLGVQHIVNQITGLGDSEEDWKET